MRLSRNILVFFALILVFANVFAVMAPQDFSKRLDNALLINSYYNQSCAEEGAGEEIAEEGLPPCPEPIPSDLIPSLNSLYSEYYSFFEAKDLVKAKQKLDQVILGLDELQGYLNPELDFTGLKIIILREYAVFERDIKLSQGTDGTTYTPGETIKVPGAPGPAANTAPQPEEATVPVPLIGQMSLSMVALFIISLVLVTIVGLFLLHLTKKA